MTPWVLRLIVVTVATFFLSWAVPGMGVLVFYPQQFLTRPWTIVTYMFLHADLMHLLFNMLALVFFGPPLERRLGSRRFLGLYFAGGLAGALASFATPGGILGASAGTFAVSLGFARYWPNAVILIWGIIPVRAWLMVAIMTGLALLGAGGIEVGQRNVAHLAHLGGFLGGWIYLKIVETRTGAARFRARAAPTTTGIGTADVERWRKVDRGAMHPVNREEFERVLAKIESHGVASITGDERAFLDRFAAGAAR
jgi:membrane associated rhomboid family serine protease